MFQDSSVLKDIMKESTLERSLTSVKNVVNVFGKELISEDMPWSTLERSLLSVNNVANDLAAKDT